MRWLVQLLLGLNHIHRKAILHRDIKPANVFLSKSRKVVRLGDSGIAKKLREDDDLATTVVGTPLYMSPELCQGKPYTYASDIWALGCVAYEMASGGAKAFDAPGWPQLLVKIVRGDYAPVPSHLSRPFAALVASMLSPDPAERPTAEQLLGTPIVRRHCEALLRDARDAKKESAESAADDRWRRSRGARAGRTPRARRAPAPGKAFARPGRRSRHHRRAFWRLRRLRRRGGPRFSAFEPRERRRRRGRREARRRGGAVRGAAERAAPRPHGGARRRPSARGGARQGGRGRGEAHGQTGRLARRRRRRRRSSWRGDTRRRRDAKRRASAFFRPRGRKRRKRKSTPRREGSRVGAARIRRGGPGCRADPRAARSRVRAAPEAGTHGGGRGGKARDERR